MKRRSAAYYEARARVAKAMAHPTRVFILEVLQEREWCVCELTDLIGADQSTVSKHLALLKQAGLVEVRREGTMVFYRLRCKCIPNFFNCIESVLKANLQAHQEVMN
ncbi:MAG TPA: metalloregulator ArsR/SmtB family transcription factor [Phycisphaerae bacterium]|nr:metalloregulator ArsR/SmtB family transcription factor [Phycisphaerae bacterium]HRY67636.1 metalloregulator ArsR/SmtB family transcription factor [Phycisphaerae bacterium]HSA25023.1 metalloregulator ArsR/SmtB family transcription factor [Phycisphaerae bacterium]